MRRLLLAVTVGCIILPIDAVQADEVTSTDSDSAVVRQKGGVRIEITDKQSRQESRRTTPSNPRPVVDPAVLAVGSIGRAVFCANGDVAVGGECSSPRAVASGSQVIRRAFEELTIPKSKIVIQPPNGLTLVNMETLFRTEAEAYDESVTLLGHQVTLRIRPVQFVWLPGDGKSFTTATPGIAFEKGRPMSDYVSHAYLQPAETVHPSVNVVWAATYSIDGAAWQDVAGTVTTTGPSADLQVKEAVPVLTSGG